MSQRRISGKEAYAYRWVNQTTTAHPTRTRTVYVDTPPENESLYKRYKELFNKLLSLILLVCVIFGVIAFIGKTAEIMELKKTNGRIAESNGELRGKRDNLVVELGNNMTPEAINNSAEDRLEMRMPMASETVSLHIFIANTKGNPQTAEASRGNSR